jgi:hypothetical protein
MTIWSRGLAAIAFGFLLWTSISNSVAGAKTQAAREAAEYIIRKFGKEGVKEGEEGIASRLERLAAKHGDEVFEAARRSGPRGIKVIEDLGDNSEAAMKLLTKYGEKAVDVAKQPKSLALAMRLGDEATEVLIRHPGIAEPVIEGFGKPAAAAMKGLNGQNARRLAMMVDDGSLAKIPQQADLLGVIGKYGNPAMDFIWKHKGVFIGGTIAASFWSNPEPYIKGVVDLSKELVTTTATSVAHPLADEAARQIPWTTLALLTFVVFIGGWYGKRLTRWLRKGSKIDL